MLIQHGLEINHYRLKLGPPGGESDARNLLASSRNYMHKIPRKCVICPCIENQHVPFEAHLHRSTNSPFPSLSHDNVGYWYFWPLGSLFDPLAFVLSNNAGGWPRIVRKGEKTCTCVQQLYVGRERAMKSQYVLLKRGALKPFSNLHAPN